MGISVLIDSGCKYKGVKFWGSPITPRFNDWAFNRSIIKEHSSKKFPYIEKHWKKIPKDVDVLITHGPPIGIMDISKYGGHRCGCPHLRKYVEEIKPKYHIFGHIHEGRGVLKEGSVVFINASSLDHHYSPYLDKAISFELELSS